MNFLDQRNNLPCDVGLFVGAGRIECHLCFRACFLGWENDLHLAFGASYPLSMETLVKH